MTASNSAANLKEKTINQLCVGEDKSRLRFHIPSYQRGYRWTSHVTKLMDDIYDFASAKKRGLNVGSAYCLQPIIMKRRQDLDNTPQDGVPEMGYEVVDGQQRLMTVLILLNVLGHHAEDGIFRISFERDDNCKVERESFLKSVASKTDSECEKPDFFYIRQAFRNAKEWLKKKTAETGENPRPKLYSVLFDEVKVIWYELPDDDMDVRLHFRNINAGRIQLTDAELVKAMMLNSKHYQAKDPGEAGVRSSNETIRMMQERIARVWDDCERSLQDDAFWGFITCDPRPRSKRMDFLLELYYKALSLSGTEDTTVSAFFESLLTSEKIIRHTWKKILELFRKIQDWFADVSLYNYIGLLVHYRGAGKKNTLLDLIGESKERSKSGFQEWILDAFYNEIQITSEAFNRMNYFEQRIKIKWMLMLFNIKLMNKLGRRFDFAVEEGWSVEHIFARESVDINVKKRKGWVERHLRVVDSRLKDCGESSIAEIRELREKMVKYVQGDSNADFHKLFSDFLRLIDTPESDIDNICNLALLGLKDNKTLHNDSFYDKRGKIIDMIENGRNIPVGTERVFLKSFPDTAVTSLDYWSSSDGQDYVNYMQKIIFG